MRAVTAALALESDMENGVGAGEREKRWREWEQRGSTIRGLNEQRGCYPP